MTPHFKWAVFKSHMAAIGDLVRRIKANCREQKKREGKRRQGVSECVQERERERENCTKMNESASAVKVWCTIVLPFSGICYMAYKNLLVYQRNHFLARKLARSFLAHLLGAQLKCE